MGPLMPSFVLFIITEQKVIPHRLSPKSYLTTGTHNIRFPPSTPQRSNNILRRVLALRVVQGAAQECGTMG